MSKLDVYLRSIERFGATGAVLTSGQAVTLRFPTGDRNATQVTPHDQLVIMIREVAPPAVLDQIDKQRPARFEIDSEGHHYVINVAPKPGAWQVGIDQAAPPAQPVQRAPTPIPRDRPTPPPGDLSASHPGNELAIERGQYDVDAAPVAVTASGSDFLDQLTTSARQTRATDIYLAAGVPPLVRAGGELTPSDRGPVDADTISREIGVVAPAEARGAWSEQRSPTFAYGDGAGRVRVTLTRDHRGPGAALRLLHGEAPPVERIGLPNAVGAWLGARGLVLIAGPSGSGKTTTLAAIVRALGDRRRSVVSIEDPIEIVHTSRAVSQRAIGEHVATFAEGVAAAMREGADVIAIGAVTTPDAATAVLEALAAGHLVVATIPAPGPQMALERLLDRVDAGHRDHAQMVVRETWLGTITPIVGRGGTRTFEALGRDTQG